MKQNSLYLLKGLFLSTFFFILLILFLAFLMQQTGWSDSVILPLLVIVFCLSTFLGSLYFAKHTDKRRFLWGILFGMAFFVLYLAAAFAITPPDVTDGSRLLTFLASSLASGCIGGMLS